MRGSGARVRWGAMIKCQLRQKSYSAGLRGAHPDRSESVGQRAPHDQWIGPDPTIDPAEMGRVNRQSTLVRLA